MQRIKKFSPLAFLIGTAALFSSDNLPAESTLSHKKLPVAQENIRCSLGTYTDGAVIKVVGSETNRIRRYTIYTKDDIYKETFFPPQPNIESELPFPLNRGFLLVETTTGSTYPITYEPEE